MPPTNPDSFSLNRMFALSAGALALMFAVSGWAWVQLPAGAQIPVHWNAAGEVDGYGSKFVGLLLLPLVSVGLVGLFALIPRIEPRRLNLEQSATAFRALWGMLLFYLLAFHTLLTLSVLGYEVPINRVLPPLVGLLFIVIGNYFGKIRSNFLMGIRTPWTLSSDLAWDKTHRLGGRLFVGLGVLVVASVLLPPTWWVWVLLVGLFASLPVLFIYSYLIWKRDPQARRL